MNNQSSCYLFQFLFPKIKPNELRRDVFPIFVSPEGSPGAETPGRPLNDVG